MTDLPLNYEPTLDERLDEYRRVCKYCRGEDVMTGYGIPYTREWLQTLYGEPSEELRLQYRKKVVDTFYKVLNSI